MLMTAGIIGPAHGLRGEAIVDVRSDDPAIWAPGSVLVLEGGEERLTVLGARVHKDRVLVSFDEIDSREGIEALRGRALLVEERAEEDAWYPHELAGCEARTPEGELLGVVEGLRFGPAQDLLLVRTADRLVMVPFVEALVPEVDVAARTVTIAPPPGLFDDRIVVSEDREGAR
ncbi:ribosome maturation factor RimM [Actinomyces culturomici]|uniref:ribosome maturation factor RimM n=1 Tax=Actinomyces culturomici TaxID=1926276 RepID=UPI000E20A83B|nr:ribosome maturation factor RimM [Actinomyces culturomici]